MILDRILSDVVQILDAKGILVVFFHGFSKPNLAIQPLSQLSHLATQPLNHLTTYQLSNVGNFVTQPTQPLSCLATSPALPISHLTIQPAQRTQPLSTLSQFSYLADLATQKISNLTTLQLCHFATQPTCLTQQTKPTPAKNNHLTIRRQRPKLTVYQCCSVREARRNARSD